MTTTCQACGGFIERGADGVWRHLARWEPCISARPRTRTEAVITADQRQALARYLDARVARDEWRYWAIGVAVIAYLALLSRGNWSVFVLGICAGVAITFTLIGLMTRSHAAVRRDTTLVRVTGSLVVDTRSDADGERRFVRIDGREVWLDGTIHVPREIGGIEYTRTRRFPLAIWDRDGDLLWHRPEYQPAALDANTMGLTA